METIEIKTSSAISKISFNEEESLVGISFTYNQDKEYIYYCEEITQAKEKILDVYNSDQSIGKLINSFRKDGTFSLVDI